MQINQFHLGRMRWNAIVRFAQWTYVFSDWFAPFSIAYAAKPQRNVHVFSWDVDHFIFPLWLLWIKRKSLKCATWLIGTKCQFSFELISFSLENTHTHTNCPLKCFVAWMTVMHLHTLFVSLHSFLIWHFFFSCMVCFFALSSPKYTTLSFFSPSISQLFFEIPTLFADLMALFCFKHRN